MKDFFISYSKDDRRWAEWIAWQVEEAGYTTIAEAWDFKPGANFVTKMHKALKMTDRVIMVASEKYFDSKFTKGEWTAAYAENSDKLIMVRISDYKPDGLLRPVIYIDLFGLNEEDAKEGLLKGIKKIQSKPSTQSPYPGSSLWENPRFPGSLPPVCNLPSRNRNFTGRESLLTDLRTAFTTGGYAASTQTLTGPNGVGKTQLAIEYAYRYSHDYDLIWWLNAEVPATLTDEIVGMAESLCFPKEMLKETPTSINAVKDWLEQNNRWLLIFDNAMDQESIKGYLPGSASGHVLITSRNPNWNKIGCVLPVTEFKPDCIGLHKKNLK